jgi:hypothetical protein
MTLEKVSQYLVVEEGATRTALGDWARARARPGAGRCGSGKSSKTRYGLFVAALALTAMQAEAFAPLQVRPVQYFGSRLVNFAASASGQNDGDKKKAIMPSEEELKATVSSVYSSPAPREAVLLDPNDFPELLSDLPGYEVIEEYKETGEFVSIFDDPSAAYRDTEDPYSIAHSTLREISESYDFSLAFLGDFVTQMGASSPIDIDTAISAYLTGEQIFTLLQAVNSLDPSEAGLEYADSLSAQELCDESGLSTNKLLDICRAEGFSLPFGLDTVLHVSVVQRILDAASGEQPGGYVDDDTDDENVFVA